MADSHLADPVNKVKENKKIATLYTLLFFREYECHGQPTNKPTITKQDELTTFEQKEKTALASRSSITASPQISGYNERYVAKKGSILINSRLVLIWLFP